MCPTGGRTLRASGTRLPDVSAVAWQSPVAGTTVRGHVCHRSVDVFCGCGDPSVIPIQPALVSGCAVFETDTPRLPDHGAMRILVIMGVRRPRFRTLTGHWAGHCVGPLM